MVLNSMFRVLLLYNPSNPLRSVKRPLFQTPRGPLDTTTSCQISSYVFVGFSQSRTAERIRASAPAAGPVTDEVSLEAGDWFRSSISGFNYRGYRGLRV